MIIGPWAIAPALITGAAGFFGQERTNRQNLGESRRNRQFQAAQAEKQMAFQERMRNTQWQSAIADMEAAGINPALAYSQGPNAAPGGAAGGGAQATVGDSVSSAMSMLMQSAQLEKIKAEVQSTQYSNMEQGARLAKLLDSTEGESLVRRMLEAEFRDTAASARLKGAQADIATPKGDLFKALGDDIMPIILQFIRAAGGAANRLSPGGN